MFNPIKTAALRKSAVNLYTRIRNEEIFYANIKTISLRFYPYQDHLKIYQMYVIFKDAKKFKQKKFKTY